MQLKTIRSLSVLLFIGLGSVTTSGAQTKTAAPGSIRGSIQSPAGEPLVGINVGLEGTTLGVPTDERGEFTLLNVPAGTYTLLATGVGYSASQQNVTVAAGKVTALALQLDEATQSLREVTVAGRRGQNYLESVAETGTRTPTPLKDIPQSIQVVPKAILQEQQVYRLNEVFKNVAGITDQSDLNYVNIRGFTTSSANFMFNGQRNGYVGLDQSPQLPYVDRVEVLKGPSSVLYGNGAIGGTINLVTKKPRKEFHTNANLTFGSFNLTRFQADVTGSLNKSKTLAGLVNIGVENGGNFYQDFENKSIIVTPVFTWKIGSNTDITSTTILRSARETAAPTGIPIIGNQNLFAVPDNFRYAADDGKYTSLSIQEQLNVSHRFNSKLSANGWFNFSRRRTDANIYQPGNYSPRTDSISRFLQVYEGRLRGYALNAYLTYQFKTGALSHTLVSGLDYNSYAENYPTGFSYYSDIIRLDNPDYTPFRTDGITPDYYYSNEENYGPTRSIGGYVQDQINITEKLKALLALRYDDYRYTYYGNFDGSATRDTSQATAFVPKVGIVYQPTGQLSVYGSYSEGFQPQSSNGRLAGGPFPPVRARQYELGTRGEFFKQRLLATIAAYQIKQENVLKPDPADPAGIRQVTAGQVTSRGLEVTVTGALTSQWNLLANYAKNKTFTSRSNDPGEIGQEFGDTPRDAVSFWSTYQFTQLVKGLKVGLGYRHNSNKKVYGIPFPGYSVVNALLSYTYRDIGLAVNANNIADKRYAVGTFGTSYYYPGTPRSFQVSISYNAW
ncbi:MAG: TonB-dependent receptor [Ferruginibacter sp.]|nr:TonB-dependent receptor [Cytophagales bacterium]